METTRAHHPRRCDTCHACCVVPKVDSIGKPEGQPCPHLRPTNVRGSCGIYGKRPDECRSFMCAWLLSPEMPDRLRPDRAGIVLKPTHPEDGQPVLEVWEAGEKWEESAVYRWFWSIPQSSKFKLKIRRQDEAGEDDDQ